MSEWQPIETAPRDGTYIDVWYGKDKCDIAMRYTDCFWSREENSWCYYDTDSTIVTIFSGNKNITHWMPLPKPPEDI